MVDRLIASILIAITAAIVIIALAYLSEPINKGDSESGGQDSDDALIESTKNMIAVRVFLEKYPEARVEVLRNDASDQDMPSIQSLNRYFSSTYAESYNW